MHQSVLLNEAIKGLRVNMNGKYIDTTFGRGGHTKAIVSQLTNGQLMIMDKDPEAIAVAHDLYGNHPNVIIKHQNFSELESAVNEAHWTGEVDGILFDLGVSSPQLDTSERGFSFQHDGPLDMRMNPNIGISAADWIKSVDESTLATVIKQYGEEQFAKRIAKAIITARETQSITTTKQLAEIIAKAHPRWKPNRNPATQTFQAIRIFINSELNEIESALPQAVTALKKGGRLAVISFHSLEDRIVKHFMRGNKTIDTTPRKLPITITQTDQLILKCIGKPIYASDVEKQQNPRARSAVLRIAEKM